MHKHEARGPDETAVLEPPRQAARGQPLWIFASQTQNGGTPATYGLLITIAAFWVATLACGGADFTPALVRLGAQIPAPGEPWRLWSYAFLHGSWAHVFMNAYVLWRIGRPLEMLLGTSRFVALYSVTALAGGLATALASKGLSVGASGALWGLFGAEAVLVLGPRPTLPPTLTRKARGVVAQNLLLNTMISFLPRVNAAAHFAGGVTGVLMMLTVLAPGLPCWGEDKSRPVSVPVWLQRLAWLSGSALLASAVMAVVVGRPWALGAPGPTIDARLPSGRVLAVPTQLKARTDKTVGGSVVWGNLLSDPAVVLATEIPLGELPPGEAREHLDTFLGKQPDGTRIVEPPTRVQRREVTVVEARYIHKTGGLWESAVVLIPGGDTGGPAEILRVDVVLHARTGGPWRGLATAVAASANATDAAGG
jgi:rhomboid protease GluP